MGSARRALLGFVLTVTMVGCAEADPEDSRAQGEGAEAGVEEPSTVVWNGPAGSQSPEAGSQWPGEPDAASPEPWDAGGSPPGVDAGLPTEPDAALPPEQDAAPPPPACTYPSGPYGRSVGSIVSPDLVWQGFRPGSAGPESITPNELFDCDGSRGIHAIYAVYVAGWCPACRAEAEELGAKAAQWAGQGVVVLTLMTQSSSGDPATTSNASSWRSQFGLENTYVCADPDDQLFAGNYLPYELLIDPRTMTVTETGDVSDASVTYLAASNL